MDDISIRAIETLNLVDFIICENPKHSLKLLNKLGIKKKLISLHDYNEIKVINKIKNIYKKSAIALISDAGSPLISDPGYRLIRFYIENNFYFTTIPGASSVISSLQLSGLSLDKFVFFGFLPKNKNGRKKNFEEVLKYNLTSVFFVSQNYLKDTLEEIINFFEDRNIVVCKEISKKNEQVYRNNAKNILSSIKDRGLLLKGEFVLIIEQNKKILKKNITNKEKVILNNLLKKISLTDAVKIVHNLTDISKKQLYNYGLSIKK